MIETCVVCKRTYNAPYLGWASVYIPRVCGRKCFVELIQNTPAPLQTIEAIRTKTPGIIEEFTESDRSLRSNYERWFMKVLHESGLNFMYEPYVFYLSDRSGYVPDFLIGTTLFEIKGEWRGDGKKKFKLFLQDYPTLKIYLVEHSTLKRIGRRANG